MVAAGTRKLSEGATVTASDEAPIIGELAMVTDGDKEGADGSFVEFGPGVQWVQIDLGADACDQRHRGLALPLAGAAVP